MANKETQFGVPQVDAKILAIAKKISVGQGTDEQRLAAEIIRLEGRLKKLPKEIEAAMKGLMGKTVTQVRRG